MTTPISQFYKVIHTKVIGQGISGKVCECVRKADGVSFAVKIINRKSLTVADAQHIANEIRCLQTLDHPNIVQLVDTFEDATNFYLVMEYIRGGELFSRISKKQYYNERDARDLCEQILAGIKHCHDHDIVHRDIKPENFMMLADSDDANVKLVDFGFAAISNSNNLHGIMGTPIYMAPEIWNQQPYGRAVDMWSFGVILYILLAGYAPFADDKRELLKKRVRKAKFAFHADYWSNVSQEAQDLITRLLTVDPAERLTVDQALAHPWLSSGLELQTHSLGQALVKLKTFNARRAFKSAVNAVLAINKLKRMLGGLGSPRSVLKSACVVLGGDCQNLGLDALPSTAATDLDFDMKAMNMDATDAPVLSMLSRTPSIVQILSPTHSIAEALSPSPSLREGSKHSGTGASGSPLLSAAPLVPSESSISSTSSSSIVELVRKMSLRHSGASADTDIKNDATDVEQKIDGSGAHLKKPTSASDRNHGGKTKLCKRSKSQKAMASSQHAADLELSKLVREFSVARSDSMRSGLSSRNNSTHSHGSLPSRGPSLAASTSTSWSEGSSVGGFGAVGSFSLPSTSMSLNQMGLGLKPISSFNAPSPTSVLEASTPTLLLSAKRDLSINGGGRSLLKTHPEEDEGTDSPVLLSPVPPDTKAGVGADVKSNGQGGGPRPRPTRRREWARQMSVQDLAAAFSQELTKLASASAPASAPGVGSKE